MKVLNFVRKGALAGLLSGDKGMSIRPAFDVGSLDNIVETAPEFTISQKARLVWRRHSDFLYYCRCCGERAYSQDGEVTGHADCEKQAPFNKYVGTATVYDVQQVELGYWLDDVRPYVDFWPGQAHIWTEEERDETLLHRVPWFNQKYDLKKDAKPFWVYVFREVERPAGKRDGLMKIRAWQRRSENE
jgi:hypothetical protein